MNVRRLREWLRLPCKGSSRARRPEKARPRLGLEQLEDRTVPTIVFGPRFGAETLVPPTGGGTHYTTLSSPTVYLIFWGSYWSTTAGIENANTLGQNVARTILGSTYLSGLTEYGSNGRAVFGAQWIDPRSAASDPPAGFNAGDPASATTVQNEIVHAIDDPTSPIFAPAFHTAITSSPIYVVVTDPNHAGSSGGYNVPGTYTTTNTAINMISVGTRSSGMADRFGRTFSHEMAERMSDPTEDGHGVEVYPPTGIPSNLLTNPSRPATDPSNLSQIGDNEPEPSGQPHYSYRIGGASGVTVQPYWSNAFQAFIVPDGNSQRFNLAPSWQVDTIGGVTTATFNGTYALTINGDQLASHNDTIFLDVVNNGAQVTLNGQTVRFDPGAISQVEVYTGSGVNTVNVLGTVTPVTIHAEGTDTINVGKGGRVGGVLRAVTVQGSSRTTLNVDDSADPTNQAVIVSASAVTFQGVTKVAYGLSTLNSLTVHGGAGNDTISVPSTPVTGTTTLDTGAGTNTINLSATSHDLASVDGLIVNGGGRDTLVLNDQADPNTISTVYTIADHTVSRGGTTVGLANGRLVIVPAPVVSVHYSGVANLVLNGGNTGPTATHGDVFDVLSTAAGTTTTLNGGDGNDTFNLSPQDHNLDLLPGALVVNGGGGTDTLVANDQANLNTVQTQNTITASSFSRVGISQLFGPVPVFRWASVSYGALANLVVDTGPFPTVTTVTGTAFGTLATINAGPGQNVIVASPGSAPQTALNLAVHGAGHTNLVYDDQADFNQVNQLTVSATGLAFASLVGPVPGQPALRGGSITYNGVVGVAISPSNFTNFIYLASTAAGTPVEIDSNHGQDILTVGNALGGLQGALTVNGRAGFNDVLLVKDVGTSAPETFTLAPGSVARSGAAPITFAHVSALQVVGGSGGNVFNVLGTPAGVPVEIDTGSGHDTVNVGDASNTLGPIQGPLGIIGRAGVNDVLNINDQGASTPAGYALAGNALTRGGAAPITFAGLASLVINGAGGSNQISVAGLPAGTQATFHGGGGTNALVAGFNADHVWRLTGTNAGTFDGSVAFTGVQSLIGAYATDRFVFSDGARMTGGLTSRGVGTLDYSAYTTAVVVNLATGAATGTGGVAGIANVLGGAGDDTLTAGSGNAILVGGRGHNVLVGGSGRDLLIGGAGAAQITAGPGDAILIAGTTAFDRDLTALTAIMREWGRTDATYAQRIDHLMSGTGLNGPVRLLSGTTVLDNGLADTLTGSAGMDWFFANLSRDRLNGRRPEERVN
jgi:hypothetical protein